MSIRLETGLPLADVEARTTFADIAWERRLVYEMLAGRPGGG